MGRPDIIVPIDPRLHPLLQALLKLNDVGYAPWHYGLAGYLVPMKRLKKIEIKEIYAETAEKLAPRCESLVGTAVQRMPSLVASGYELAISRDREEFTQLQTIYMSAPDGTVVGMLRGGDVWVHPGHRLRGLGSEMMLARVVMNDNGRQCGFLYSPGGIAAAIGAYRLAHWLAPLCGVDLQADPTEVATVKAKLGLVPKKGPAGPAPR